MTKRQAGPRPRVLIAEPRDFSPRAVVVLETACDVTLEAVDDAGLRRAFDEYDVIWVRLARQVRAELIGPRPRCRVLATATTGLDHVDLATCERLGIRVVSLRGEVAFLRNIRATAEHTLALTLSLLRRIPAAHQSVVDGDWDRDRFRGSEIYEKTIGIVGVGRIGSILAGYFRALGAEVVGYDPRPDFPREVARPCATLSELLKASDVACLAVTYDASTRHLVGPAEFAILKPGCVLVNTSRGGVVDERALVAALESGRVAGAALDVVEGEPSVGADHPLAIYARTHHNLLLTPHLGGNTRESLDKTEVFIARRVIEAVAAVPAVVS